MTPKWEVLLTWPFLVSVLVIGISAGFAIWLLLRWRERNKDETKSPQSYLKDFEEMRLGGDLSEAEYRNIRSLLDGKKTPPPRPTDASASMETGHG
jgi:hypothetical protein